MNQIFVRLFATSANICTKRISYQTKLVGALWLMELSCSQKKIDLYYEVHIMKSVSKLCDRHFMCRGKLRFAPDNDSTQTSATSQLMRGTKVVSHGL